MKNQIHLDTKERFADITINGVSVAPLFAKRLTIVIEGGRPPVYTISNEDDCVMADGTPCGGTICET